MSNDQALGLFLMITSLVGFCAISIRMIFNQSKDERKYDEMSEEWRELEVWHSEIIHLN